MESIRLKDSEKSIFVVKYQNKNPVTETFARIIAGVFMNCILFPTLRALGATWDFDAYIIQ